MVKDSKRIDLYCRHCRKSLHIDYKLTGFPDSTVLPNTNRTKKEEPNYVTN